VETLKRNLVRNLAFLWQLPEFPDSSSKKDALLSSVLHLTSCCQTWYMANFKKVSAGIKNSQDDIPLPHGVHCLQPMSAALNKLPQ